MEWLNYHHLLYFWTVAREGSIARASRVLRLASPTISAQLKTLEENLGEKLFERQGRGLMLTDAGRLVLGYADEIFSLGREMMHVVNRRPTERARRFHVGVVDSVPKLIARELLKPALHMDPPAHLVVREGKLEPLVSELATHHLDMVLADHRYSAPASIKIFHHRLGEWGVTFFAAAPLARKLREGFPGSLDGAPALLHAENTAMRRSLDAWFESIGVRPRVLAEFEDSALIKVFGSDAQGFFALPSVAVAEVARGHRVQAFGSTDVCRERYYLVSAERRLKHPAVVKIHELARSLALD
jgi:LysR family transcriptional activator of nhaA